ncbi:pantoate--beta-alanine ligase [Clostridium sp. WILCCON 0269]|uniref:Pantothenate synthetase n=1 Tax=Candidatus Clostridium eludens TaxID=3381663 RepID=A0ABW8SG08_9CLOT
METVILKRDDKIKRIQTVGEVRSQVKKWKMQGLTVGLVPTMGFLHEGHESLIKRAALENDKVVVSVFVNPTQFGKNEDLGSYPRDIERDELVCKRAGASLIFNPEPSEMYCKDASTNVSVNGLTEGLCGSKRPTHFGGVCLVVSKLFNIVTPNRAYFGEKDAQQLAVVKKMVQDLNFDIEIIGCPIVREFDGLAKSSRNTYLSLEERNAASILNKSLNLAKEALDSGERNANIIANIITEKLNSEPLAKIDYIEIVDSLNLKPVHNIHSSILVAIAVYMGKTRLIDNFTFKLQR